MIKLSNNKKFILNILAMSLIVYGTALLPCVAVSLIYSENSLAAKMGILALLSILAGIILHRLIDRNVKPVLPRICYMTIIFVWVTIIALTTLSYLFGIQGCTLSDAVFLSSASLTGTGVVIYDISTLPNGLLLWHSICNWLGGVGIIMTTMSILHTWGFLGKGLVTSEFPGPTFLKKNTLFGAGYRKLVFIYVGLTILHLALLLVAGMSLKYAVLTALSNTSTSGMAHFKYGVITNLSLPIKVIITIFAFLSSVNGNVFLLIFRRKFRSLKNQSELIFYVMRIFLTSMFIIIVMAISDPGLSIPRLALDATMQVVSMLTTSGYIIADCSKWTSACILVIVFQMIIGSCSVSTGGGIKNARILIALKTLSFSTFRHVHPHSVRTMTFNREPIRNESVRRANIFIALFATTLVGGALLLSIDNIDVFAALNYSQAMLTNTGTYIGAELSPGLAYEFSSFSKVVMSMLMIAGRLEIYPFIMIFMPSFWSPENTR